MNENEDPALTAADAEAQSNEVLPVPDGDVPVLILEEAGPEFDLETLQRLQSEGAQLTEEEFAFLQQAQAQTVSMETDHYENLAMRLPEDAMTGIGQSVVNWVRWDEQARSAWFEMEKRGIQALGVNRNPDEKPCFDGASQVTHPVLAEACVQFQSRAMPQLWPAGGPVKTAIMGAIDRERELQAQRVEQFMNYQYTQLMPGAFTHTDQMLMRLPLSGSVFIKVWNDPINGVSRAMVEPADFIVPEKAANLQVAPRYTERQLLQSNDVRKRQVVGFYRDIPLVEPTDDDGQRDSDRVIVTDEIKATEGRERVNFGDDDNRRTIFECYCDLDLPGYEHKDANGNPTGIGLPYIVHVDRDSQKVLAIYRNWKPGDQRYRKIVHHIHYRFMPGLGFYGYGLYHWIGGLSDAATGALRALLDSAAFANLNGGFRSKDATLPNGRLTIAPGEWPEVDTGADDLRKAFFPMPYKEPSATLFNLLSYLDKLGGRFAGTTESVVGEGSQNIPVGTVLARIEEGARVYTTIQMRLHEAAGEEYKLVAYLDSVWMPDEYPYAVEGEDRKVLRQDFDSRVDVVPVSDPNFVSNTQRYFISSLIAERASIRPDLYNAYEVEKRILMSLKAQDIDQILPPPNQDVKRCDPVTENAKAGLGQPIKAFMEQAHDAHLAVHQQALMALDPKHPAVPVLRAHMQEHMAMAYLMQMSQATGVGFQMPTGEEQEIPVELENQIAMAAAQAAQQIQAQPPPPSPEEAKALADIQRKNQVAEADVQRKDQVAVADQQRKDFEAQQEQARADAKIAADLANEARNGQAAGGNW